MLKMPAGFASLGEKSPYNWRYETMPQKHCNDRRMYWPRGKTLGGSSAINAMLYVRGNAWDYDHWRQLGNDGWSYNDVLPFFKKAENNERGADDFHGTGGPLNVADQTDPARISEAFVKAAEQAGHKRVTDFNGAEQDGVGFYQVTQKNQERWSTASAYLRPAVERNKNNVHVVSNALVERIILDKNRAMGVRYSHQRPRRGRARRARDHPVRRRGELAAAADAVRHGPGRPPEVGRHPAAVRHAGRRRQPAGPSRRGDPAGLQDARHLRRGQQAVVALAVQDEQEGPRHLADRRNRRLHQHAGGLAAPDVQLHFLPALVVDHGRTRLKKNGYTLHVCALRPESTGTIRLKSSKPKEHPLIDANYLAERQDLETLKAGVKMGRDILAQSGLDPYRAEELEPGPAAKTDAELEQWIRARCETIYHPVGTCKMGPDNDAMAVVDNQCRVRGIEGLRVVDASVMPTVIGGNTNAPTIMIAERVAAYMQGKG